MLGVFAHPDDESLLAGGTLARYAAQGERAVVLTCTGGEAGDSWDPLVDPAHITETRHSELREACARLGVAELELLHFRDSGLPARARPGSLCEAPLEQLVSAIHGVIRRHAPDAVVTHDATGGYGHPDHIRVNEATTLAVERSGSACAVFSAVMPQSLVERFAQAFRQAGLRAGRAAAAGADLERDVGVPDDQVSAIIDVSAYVRTKRAALNAHRTQMTGHVLFRLPWPVLAELWNEEHFSLAKAPPGRVWPDLFEAASAIEQRG